MSYTDLLPFSVGCLIIFKSFRSNYNTTITEACRQP